ncbi:VOC family protein [Xanthomonas theicola]|uniref:VOC family protein n=1 Tax=Xanthomonas theicola TaxID=56464 RepID=UPI001B807B29|nr:VOC family protein [Xanthomonas theicola]
MTKTKGMTGIHHVGVAVQDLQASADWYAKRLGLQRMRAFAFPGAEAVFVGQGRLRIERIQSAGAAPMAAERRHNRTNPRLGDINHLAIAAEDLDRTVEELRTNRRRDRLAAQ